MSSLSRVGSLAGSTRTGLDPLVWRFGLLLSLLGGELLIASLRVDTASGRHGVLGFLDDWGSAVARSVLAAVTVFVALIYVKRSSRVPTDRESVHLAAISVPLLGLHLLAVAAFSAISVHLFSRPVPSDAQRFVLPLIVSAVLAAIAGVCAFVPAAELLAMVQQAGRNCVYAVVAGILAFPAGELWRVSTVLVRITFALVTYTLRPFLADLIVEPATRIIGTPRFSVILTPQCSGLEGAALMVIFGGLWLWMFRDEYRVGRALLAIPVGVAILSLLNVVRICALILIGNTGAVDIAAKGFHSQAGWIAFNIVGVALMLGARNISWLRKEPSAAAISVLAAENPTAVYLIPFITILAAAMVSHAASSGFEWLYPLRFIAAAAVLLFYRRKYSAIDWRFGLSSLLIGALVFLVWLLFDRFMPGASGNHLEASLQQLAAPARVWWITSRILAAVLTVPIAEELAFRGFLLRRLISPQFEIMKFQQAGPIVVLVSSTAFGIMHGDRWLAGIIAGLLYAVAVKRSGRLGDAVAAHATTNALLAFWVIAGGHWQYW